MIFVLLPGSLSLTENERKNQKKYIAAKQRKKGLKRKRAAKPHHLCTL